MRLSFVALPLLVLPLGVAGCDGGDSGGDSGDSGSADSGDSGGGDSGDSGGGDSGAGDRAVTVQFRGAVGSADYDCTSTFDGIGSTATTYTPVDFRFYVHDVALIDAQGTAVPVTLAQDGLWQYDTLALLDFEDKTGSCANGTTDVNTQVVGTVPEGEYVGLTFKLGVPFALNHGDTASAPSPLNLSTMFWSWQSGYKFVRVDGTTTGLPTGAVFHLGSTGCEADAYGTVTGCTNENVAEVTFATFDSDADTVVADLAGLFDGVDMDTNTTEMSVCMSAPTDTDCAPLFDNVGLAFDGVASQGQTFFRVE